MPMNIKDIITEKYSSRGTQVLEVKEIFQSSNAQVLEIEVYSTSSKGTYKLYSVVVPIPELNILFMKNFLSIFAGDESRKERVAKMWAESSGLFNNMIFVPKAQVLGSN